MMMQLMLKNESVSQGSLTFEEDANYAGISSRAADLDNNMQKSKTQFINGVAYSGMKLNMVNRSDDALIVFGGQYYHRGDIAATFTANRF